MESNYLHLLKPLRVLADNWDIDVAAELSEYVDGVERLTQLHQQPSLHPGDSALGVNFAQAALLIQNSANIYSKKVQYLYNLTHETHDYIFHRKQVHDDDETPHATHAKEIHHVAFECLDEGLLQRDCRLNRSDMLPVQSLPLLHGASNKMAAELGMQEELVATNGERVGYKHEFEMNESLMDEQGMLSMQSALRFQAEAGSLDVELLETVAMDDEPVVQVVVEETVQMLHEAPMDFDDGGFGGDDMPMEDFGAESDNEERPCEMVTGADPLLASSAQLETVEAGMVEQPRPVRKSRVVQEVEEQKPKEDPSERFWTMLDPYDTDASASRPFRKAAVSKTFRQVEKMVKQSSTQSKRVEIAIQDFLEQMAFKGRHEKPMPKDPIRRLHFPEFDYIYLQVCERRDQLLLARKEKAKQNLQSSADFREVVLEEVDEAQLDANEVFDIPDEMNYTVADDAQEELHDELDDADNPFDDFGYDAPPPDEPLPAAMFNAADQQTIQSFETLCKLKIKNYLDQADVFEQRVESNLAKRIRKWENRLQPLLEEQNNRRQYDIELYRERVLGAVHDVTEEKHETIPFASIAEKVEKFDICRYFLASLHLANEGRLLISKSEDESMLIRPL